MAHRWVIVLACIFALVSTVPLLVFGGKDYSIFDDLGARFTPRAWFARVFDRRALVHRAEELPGGATR